MHHRDWDMLSHPEWSLTFLMKVLIIQESEVTWKLDPQRAGPTDPVWSHTIIIFSQSPAPCQMPAQKSSRKVSRNRPRLLHAPSIWLVGSNSSVDDNLIASSSLAGLLGCQVATSHTFIPHFPRATHLQIITHGVCEGWREVEIVWRLRYSCGSATTADCARSATVPRFMSANSPRKESRFLEGSVSLKQNRSHNSPSSENQEFVSVWTWLSPGRPSLCHWPMISY